MRVGESLPLFAEAYGKIQVQPGARGGSVVARSKGKEGHQKKWGSETETLPFNLTILPKAWHALKVMLHLK